MSVRRGLIADAAGIGLMVALVGWVQVSAAISGGDARGHTALLALLAAGFVLGRALDLGVMSTWAAPAALATYGVWVALRDWDVLFAGPLNSPLGYSNATGGFYGLVAAAALIVAARTPHRRVVALALAVAVAAAVVPWANGTRIAAAMTLLLPFGLIAGLGRRAAVGVVITAGVLTVAAFAATVWIGTTHGSGDHAGWAQELVDTSLSERRPRLWADALAMLADNPATGVGPSRFAEVSPTALDDPDAAWAHQEWLQLGGETGWPGLALGVALLGWAFARLAWSAHEAGAGVATVALASISVQANLDYVLHFPETMIAIGLVVAAGVSTVPLRPNAQEVAQPRPSAESR